MFAVGYKLFKNGSLVSYSVTSDVAHVLPDVSIEGAKFASKLLLHVLNSICSAEHGAACYQPAVMSDSDGICCSGDILINLGNASHYHRGDASMGFGVWTKLTKDKVGN